MHWLTFYCFSQIQKYITRSRSFTLFESHSHLYVSAWTHIKKNLHNTPFNSYIAIVISPRGEILITSLSWLWSDSILLKECCQNCAKEAVAKPLMWVRWVWCRSGGWFCARQGKWQHHYSFFQERIKKVIWRKGWKFDFSHCKKPKQNVCVCCWACVHTNHCLAVTSLDNGLSSGGIDSAYYIKNQSKRGILRQSYSLGIPAWLNNWSIMLGVTLQLDFFFVTL